jgi:hypothetical protein
MNRKFLSALLLFLIPASGLCAHEECLRVYVHSTKSEYAKNEPILIDCEIYNPSDVKKFVRLDPCDDLLPITFSTQQLPARLRKHPLTYDGPARRVEIAPHTLYHRYIALNRYFHIPETAQATVYFSADFHDPLGISKTFATNGVFTISVVDGLLGKDELRKLPSTLSVGSTDKRLLEFECALWTLDIDVIKAMDLPNESMDTQGVEFVKVVDSNWDTGAARALIERAMLAGGEMTLRAGLKSQAVIEAGLGLESLRTLLHSEDKLFSTLNYMATHPSRDYKALVSSFRSHPNPHISRLAEQIWRSSAN